MKALMKLICAALLASVATSAGAQDSTKVLGKDATPELSPYYVGASWGAGTQYRFGCYGPDCGHNTSRSGKLYGGYIVNNRMAAFGDIKMTDAIELGLYRASGNSNVSLSPTQSSRDHALFTSLTATWATGMQLNDSLALNTRLGVAYTHTKWESYMSAPNSFLPTKGNDNRFGPTAGLGLSYAVTRNVKLHADYDYIPVSYGSANDKNHLSVWSVGASYRF